MKALLKKDILVLRRQLKFVLPILVLFAVIPNISMGAYAIVYSAMLPFSSIAYDERCHWSQLAGTMPYSTRTLVLSKYVFGWICIGSACCITLVSACTIEWESLITGNPLLDLFSVFLMALLAIAVSIPLMFRFGVENARVMVILFLGVGFAIAAISGYIIFSHAVLVILIPVLLAVTVIATLLSIRLSMQFYQQYAVLR